MILKKADMKDSFSNRYNAAQFTFNDGGEKVLTVTPKSDFRSGHRIFKRGANEAIVIDEATKVDEDSAVIEIPADQSIHNGFSTHLFEDYDKLLILFKKLL